MLTVSVNHRVRVGCFQWCHIGGESSIAHEVALVKDDEYEVSTTIKASMPKMNYGDCYAQEPVDRLGGRKRVF